MRTRIEINLNTHMHRVMEQRHADETRRVTTYANSISRNGFWLFWLRIYSTRELILTLSTLILLLFDYVNRRPKYLRYAPSAYSNSEALSSSGRHHYSVTNWWRSGGNKWQSILFNVPRNDILKFYMPFTRQSHDWVERKGVPYPLVY